MKNDKKEILEIARKLLKESTLGFRNFLNRDEFALIRENPYIMNRSDEDLASFVLFDFKDFYPNSDKVLRNLLESQGLDEFTMEKMKKVLRDSYVSLFSIEKKDDHYIFYDCILDENIEVELDKGIELSKSTKGLVRIFGEDERKMVLQLVQMMDDEFFLAYQSNLKNLFDHIEEEFGIFELNRGFIKRDFLNLLAVYEVTYENLKEEPDLDDYALYEFEELLDSFNPEDLELAQNLDYYEKLFPGSNDEFIIGFIIRLLSKIYFNTLVEKNMNFSDYSLDYKEIFKDLSESGEFLNQEELANSIDFLIIFYSKLALLGRPVGSMINDLREIQENIFYYLDLLKNSQEGFYYDDNILKILAKNKKAVFSNRFIENFDNFIEFLDMNYVSVLKSGDLSPAKLREFVDSLCISPIKEVKTYKNSHFPLIELYLNFMIKKYLTLIEGKEEKEDIYLTDTADNYLVFDDITKLAIWIEALTNKNFLKSSFGKNYEKYKTFVMDLIKDLAEDRPVGLYEYEFKNFELSLLTILEDLGIIRGEIAEIKITNFGRDIYDYYRTEEVNSNNVIKVDFK
ncbi:hypothetical protein [Peptoniphilus sp. DNF00840]|uniref:hypothetical protein n=1 Tax=Peptoniphilus sp. DNF00840 TaxID=1477000 RepID=UPI000783A95C|nr:hypothetical protein [Peptoniphilus sp. DNF00840]KXB70937.1 hypothetical protein HMPREF1864_00846 [Peptoniphilus sp. DNF00840]